MAVRRALGALLAGVVVVAGLAGGPVSGPAAADPPTDPVQEYREDAGVPLTVHRDGNGRVDFVGSRAAGVRPVGRKVPAARAAGTQWDRVAPVFGAEHAELRQRPATPSVDGGAVVRLEQYVGGLPVLGGEVVLGLDERGGLSSAAASLTTAEEAGPASYDIAKARENARRVVRKAQPRAGALSVTDHGAWLYDPAILPGPKVAATTVFRFTVADGLAVRETVLVDAGTGGVLLHFDQVASLNRRVCDDQNAFHAARCQTGSVRVAREEGGATAAVADANAAYDLMGETSDFYAGLGVDLTDLIGWGGVDGTAPKALTASVRTCDDPSWELSCPLDNAFWNGEGIFFGAGWAGADDVTGHELTHGVIERTSNLFYFHESGAINESLADVMGEIIDHRRVSPGDSPDDWRLGEDLPVGAGRDMSDPAKYGQPDRMTSPLWEADESYEDLYPDNGGVHTNSGVGNKTAYLIARGGTFNGRTVSGIDAGDAALTKTALLYLHVIQHLTSGSQYADLARALVQGCQALVQAETSGFAASDCDDVRVATEATELAKSPVVAGAKRRAEAPRCPSWASESGTSEPTLSAGALWGPPSEFGAPENSRSGDGSVFGLNPDPESGTPKTSDLSVTGGIAVPAGTHTYLRFSHWHLFEWSRPGTYYDGGRLRLDVVDASGTKRRVDPAASTWVNGPANKLALSTPTVDEIGFGGDSNGWTSSRLDLTPYAGQVVTPVWTVAGDDWVGFFGWYLDEIEVISCASQLENTSPPTVSGTPRVGRSLSSSHGTWGPGTPEYAYQWRRNGAPIAAATHATYTPVPADLGTRLSLAVTATVGEYSRTVVAPTSAAVARGTLGARTPTISGRAKVGQRLSAVRGTWTPGGITFRYRWLRDGRAITGATASTYRLTRSDARHRIQVRVTGSKAGYTTVSRTSAKTALVAR